MHFSAHICLNIIFIFILETTGHGHGNGNTDSMAFWGDIGRQLEPKVRFGASISIGGRSDLGHTMVRQWITMQ
jgi:hypothetical protein